jgi:hypothetical protein
VGSTIPTANSVPAPASSVASVSVGPQAVSIMETTINKLNKTKIFFFIFLLSFKSIKIIYQAQISSRLTSFFTG